MCFSVRKKSTHNHKMPRLSPNEKLLWALIDDNDKDMQKALAAGADANISSTRGSSPLHAAALRNSAPLIRRLVQHKVAVDQVNTAGFTPLMVAARNGREAAVKALLANGAKPNLTREDTGETALHLATGGGDPEVVRMLVAGGADTNAQTTVDMFTPLHLAAKLDSQELAGILRDDPLCKTDIEDKEGRTAAQLARQEEHHSLATHLDIYTSLADNEKELMSAVDKIDERAVENALEAGANANVSCLTEGCPLHVAALRDSASIINKLIKHRAVVDQADIEGFTPLMVAALDGKVNAVRALLDNNANPNLTRLNTGETALHMAVSSKSPGVVKALVAGGADIKAMTKDKWTPLRYAANFRYFYLVNLLQTYHPSSVGQLERKELCKLPPCKATPRLAGNRSIKVVTQDPVPPSDAVYEVTSNPRGRVLILDYTTFDTADDLLFAKNDGGDLKDLFQKMGYEVTRHPNKKKDETEEAIRNFVQEDNLKDIHCVVVCVLSHGSSCNTFYTKDGQAVTVEEVYDYFTDDNCPLLQGKPKLFLFCFCRGSSTEAASCFSKGGAVHENTGNAAIDEAWKGTPMNPVVRDRVTLYATVPGVITWVNDRYGFFLVYSVVEIFSKYAHILDVKELAKKVNNFKIHDMRASTTNLNSNITKRFYLNPFYRPE